MQPAVSACQDMPSETRMNRKALITHMARANGIDYSEAAKAYAMTTEAIRDIVATGAKLSLSGFGVFYLQKHRGHPVQFQASADKTADYLVFKFSASNTLNKFVRELGAPEQ